VLRREEPELNSAAAEHGAARRRAPVGWAGFLIHAQQTFRQTPTLRRRRLLCARLALREHGRV